MVEAEELDIFSVEKDGEDRALAMSEKMGRMDQLEQEIEAFEEDTERVRVLCEEMDSVELEKVNFRKLVDELHEARDLLNQASTKHNELLAPLQYDDSMQKTMFEKCMGLEFRLTEDKAVSLTFRHIDPGDQEKVYSVTLDVDEQNQWTVVNMDPHAHGVRALLNELNKSGNFSQFCKDIRKKFKEHTTSSNTEP